MSFVELNISDLQFFEKLGGGASGSVYRAKWKTTGKFVAAKRMLTMDKEPEVLSSLSHRNIVQFFGAVIKSPDYCIVTEFAELGCLYDFLREHSLEYSQMLLWAKQIAMGMNYLHYEAPIPVIHRDLKSRNVVIAMDLTAKICDFGSSKFHSHTTKMTLVGTFPWMAPEIIQQLPATSACDVFSYSVVLWELLTDEIPFDGLEGMQVAWLVVAKNKRLMIPVSCPPAFSGLMENCWEADPKKRPTFKQILDTLEAMLENESLKDQTDAFLQTKSIWKSELDDQLKELRLAEKDLSAKQSELDTRERLLKEREMEFTQHLRKRFSMTTAESWDSPQSHDVTSWSEDDVADWVYHIGRGEELSEYADLFVQNNISGKGLFLLTGDDLLQIGILSVGHRKVLLDEIVKLKNDNYRLLHFPPLPNTQSKAPSRPMSISGKEETLTVLFGNLYQLHNGVYKWKVFVDFDGSQSAISSIKEVIFYCSKMSGGEKQLLNKPPYISRSWIKKPIGEQIECMIIYKDGIVHSPRQTTQIFQLSDTSLLREISVKLEMVRRERHSSGHINYTTPTDIDRTLSPTTSTTRLSGAWLERSHLFPDTTETVVAVTPCPTASEAANPLSSSSSSLKNSPLETNYSGQVLQGAWVSNNMNAAAMIKKTIRQNLLPSRTSTPSGSRRGSFGESNSSGSSTPRLYPSNQDLIPPPTLGVHGAWKEKDGDVYNRSKSSEEKRLIESQRRDRRDGGRGRYHGGQKGNGNYYRSVSDNTYGQGQRNRGRGGARRGHHNPRQPSSEPINKRR